MSRQETSWLRLRFFWWIPGHSDPAAKTHRKPGAARGLIVKISWRSDWGPLARRTPAPVCAIKPGAGMVSAHPLPIKKAPRGACFRCAGAAWRGDRDSNPGDALTPNGFQDRRIRPLCHLPGPCRLSLKPGAGKASRAVPAPRPLPRKTPRTGRAATGPSAKTPPRFAEAFSDRPITCILDRKHPTRAIRSGRKGRAHPRRHGQGQT